MNNDRVLPSQFSLYEEILVDPAVHARLLELDFEKMDWKGRNHHYARHNFVRDIEINRNTIAIRHGGRCLAYGLSKDALEIINTWANS